MRPSVLESFPCGANGCVLSTSRDRKSDGELTDAGKSVQEMHEDEAIEFLLKCCRRKETANQDAIDLVKKLGYLPLAIEQAGGYIRIQDISIDRYMYLYDTNKAELLKSGLSKSHQGRFYVDTVATT